MGREIVRLEIERQVDARLDTLSNADVLALARKALGKTEADMAALRRQIEAEIPARVASVMADMLQAHCECRKRLVAHAGTAWAERLGSLSEARERLGELIESSYAHVTASLLRELRVFTAANALLFVALAVISASRPRSSVQLLLPALVLVLAAVVTATLYLFGQDWLHTLIFSDYVGLAYFGYLALAVALLSDIAFNRARVSTRILNGVASAVGAAFQAAPC
jgi:hypothetical protein